MQLRYFTIVTFFVALSGITLLAGGCQQQHPGIQAAPLAVPQVTDRLSEDLPWSLRMAASVMQRNPESWMTDFRETPRWSYTHGLVLQGIRDVYLHTEDPRYLQYVKSYYDTMIDEAGVIKNYDITEYNIDHINPGKNLFLLYDVTGDERYLKVLKTLRKQLQFHPRTSAGGFWHKLKYTNQMWLDGLYMGAPFYAQYAATFGEHDAFNDVALQFILMEQQARDSATGLLHHGWDESKIQRWANEDTGRSPEFWGRAVGWYGMGLVDALEFFPQDHPKRPELEGILQRFVAAIASVQDEKTGTWYQVLDKPGAPGNYLEATATSMFAYTLLKAARLGYVDATYQNTGRKAYEGLLDTFVEVTDEGYMHIHKCCAVAGLGGKPYRDGSYTYYTNERVISNDTKATGPFMMASLEYEKL